MSRSAFDTSGPGRKRLQVGMGEHCAGGSPPFNSGKHWKDGKCTLCERPVQRWKDGRVQPHSWQNPNKLAELERRAKKL